MINVLDVIDTELNDLGMSIQPDSCVGSNYYKRFMCENERPIIDSDSLLTIKEIVMKERKKIP